MPPGSRHLYLGATNAPARTLLCLHPLCLFSALSLFLRSFSFNVKPFFLAFLEGRLQYFIPFSMTKFFLLNSTKSLHFHYLFSDAIVKWCYKINTGCLKNKKSIFIFPTMYTNCLKITFKNHRWIEEILKFCY